MTNRQLSRALGKRILRARTRKGLSQGELAAKVGSTREAISLVESGRNSCTLPKLLKLAKALGVPAGKLLPPACALLALLAGACGGNGADCPDPRGKSLGAAASAVLVAGDPDFCADALAATGEPTGGVERWDAGACELTQEGDGYDADGDAFSYRALCNVDAHGELDCELTYTWPDYAEVCVVRVSVP